MIIKRSSFLKVYADSESEVRERLRDYLRSPGEEEVHRLRTAVRRYDRAAALLPASLRKEKPVRKFRSRLKKVSKLNNRVRDIDVIARMLSHGSGEEEEGEGGVGGRRGLASAGVWGRLRRERQDQLGPALKVAASVPREPTEIDPEKVGTKKLHKRFKKVATGILEELEGNLRAGLREQNDPYALHALRVSTKELRYTLELLPKGEEDLDDVMKELRRLQDAIGRMRDIDITTEYLREVDVTRTMEEFIREKREERRRLYFALVDSCRHTDLPKRIRRVILA